MPQSADELASVYGDGNAFFRVLGCMGWGDLVNVGYFTRPTMLGAVVLGVAPAQRSLARRSLALLRVGPGDVVLDAACGRGYTTALLGAAGCRVLGVDVLPAQVAEARRRFGDRAGVTFGGADVTAMPGEVSGFAVRDGAFDAVHCLEAAFHLGRDGRRAFLRESHRLLRVGGRLVIVDFVWAEPGQAGPVMAARDPRGLVRSTWHLEDVESRAGYLTAAVEAGFAVHRVLDWTRPAVRRGALLSDVLRRASGTAVGRHALCRRWPGLSELDSTQWSELAETLHAHAAVGQELRYFAYVFTKTGSAAGDPKPRLASAASDRRCTAAARARS